MLLNVTNMIDWFTTCHLWMEWLITEDCFNIRVSTLSVSCRFVNISCERGPTAFDTAVKKTSTSSSSFWYNIKTNIKKGKVYNLFIKARSSHWLLRQLQRGTVNIKMTCTLTTLNMKSGLPCDLVTKYHPLIFLFPLSPSFCDCSLKYFCSVSSPLVIADVFRGQG